MTVAPFREKPDLGPVKMIPNPEDPEAPLINVAGVIAIAAQEDTPKARRLYGEFIKAWASWKDRPLSDGAKQAGALKEALAAVGSTLVLTPAPDRTSR